MSDSLVGVTRKGKQGRKVSGLEVLLLIRPPPRRATSCIQLVSKFFSFFYLWKWVAMAHDLTTPCCLAAAAKEPSLSLLTRESFDRIPTRAYRFCISGTGHMLNLF